MHLRRLVWFLPLLLVVAAMSRAAEQAAAPAGRPNVVFIFADDWGWGDLSCHGHPWIKTPNIDRLAREGIDFQQFNVANPVCSPSRTAAMTGHYPARYSIHQHFAAPAQNQANGMPDWLDPRAPTVARLFQQAGYRTGHFGKWHLTNRNTHGAPPPTAYGFDEYAVFNGGADTASAPLHDTGPNAARFILAAKGRPFFVNVWLHESHLPHVPSAGSLEQTKHLGPQERVYAAVIADGDRAVGQVLAALETAGVANDTIVIFSSDNGPESTGAAAQGARDEDAGVSGYGAYYSIGSTGGLRGRKRSLFEGGVRVPFIVRWPGRVPAGVKNDTTALAAVDLLPTLCGAAGIALPRDYRSDGENLLAAWRGQPVQRSRPIFWEWQGKRAEPDWWPRLAVRDGEWKLALTSDAKRVALHRLTADRTETRDVAREHPEVVSRLTRLALEWKASLPASPDPACISAADRAAAAKAVPAAKQPRGAAKNRAPPAAASDASMDRMWGDARAKADAQNSDRAALFRDGNYGMFIHWGLYSHLGGQWKGQTFYGIGEWIKRQMKIPDAEYMAVAREFNPSGFDARSIAQLAKDAGMKWIIIAAKHHEGFAMFKSAHPFNIVDATPFARDPMKELAAACRDLGLGFGFYYSHNQDWTAPGGTNGPTKYADGTPASFEQYFREKCLPQVTEICTNYGPLSFVWFDTPGKMPKELVAELADLVRKTQPNAMLCSRIGHGLGDYVSLGDMAIPVRNPGGLWEACDTTNDSWSYAWYDQNWKDSREILHRLIAAVGRGGTYLLNVGPDGRGVVPAPAQKYLREAGGWIRRYPEVVYGAGPSPWGYALPWGDATTQGQTLNLIVFDWPRDGRLLLPPLQVGIESAHLLSAGKRVPLTWSPRQSWTELRVPAAAADHPATVIALKLRGEPKGDPVPGVHPNVAVTLQVDFAEVKGAVKKEIRWMEKFGEWKHAEQVGEWTPGGSATWEVDVAEAGEYRVELAYRGEGRLTWSIATDEGTKLQNNQNSSVVYHAYPFGLLSFRQPGRHRITVSLLDGPRDKVSLKAVQLSPVK